MIMHWATLFVALLAAGVSAEEVVCHQPGFCNGLLIGAGTANGTNECHNLCRGASGCLWFTYNAEDSFCGLYVDCETIEVLDCKCLTSEAVCPDLECNLPGQCIGNIIEEQQADSQTNCQLACSATPTCTYTTYSNSSGICILFEDCLTVTDEFCPDCVSSQPQCLIEDEGSPGPDPTVYDCADLMEANGGQDVTGVQEIIFTPDGPATEVMCAEDGWTVIQSRGQFGNPEDYFYRNWTEYSAGFGTAGEEHWLGLENMHYLTNRKTYTLRVKLTDFYGNEGIAFYDFFQIEDEANMYKLQVGSFLGTNGEESFESIGDSLTRHHNMGFTTYDNDNDASGGNCAESWEAAWWFEACFDSNLNGLNLNGADVYPWGISWVTFNDLQHSHPVAEMAVKALS